MFQILIDIIWTKSLHSVGIRPNKIFKIYECYFYDLKIKQTLNSINNDSLLEVTDGGGTVRRINRNETSKIYLDAKKTALNELTMMISDYNINDVGPLQVAGDDTVVGSFITDKYYTPRPFNRI